MLKLQILHVRTHAIVASENTPFSTKAFLDLLMSAFICKKLALFGGKSTFTMLELC